MIIKRIDETDDRTDEFINEAFTDYAVKNEVKLNYEEYCFTAEDDDGDIIGVITGIAYYNEVHIGDLIIDEKYRRLKLGSQLVKKVEEEYSCKGYEKITLTTFGFQAPEFYKKLGYSVEFVRNNANPRLSKYFLKKAI